MTRKIGNMLRIEVESDGRCEMCSKTAELRPYGKNGAKVCFDCAMKDEANARAMFIKRINGDA